MEKSREMGQDEAVERLIRCFGWLKLPNRYSECRESPSRGNEQSAARDGSEGQMMDDNNGCEL